MKRLANLGYMVLAGLALVSASGVRVPDEAECFSELVPNRPPPGSPPVSRTAQQCVKLDGIANGGELVLLEMMNPNPRYIRIDTSAGETAETVIARLAAAIDEVSPFRSPSARRRIGATMRAEGNLLKPFGGVIFAGTETGLGIPAPPTSLSVSYDAERQEVSLHWENPDGAYDAIRVFGGSTLTGTATSYVRESRPPPRQETRPGIIDRDAIRANNGLRRFYVIGCHGGVLSNAAVITLDYHDHSQQELDTQPFTGGICPNWKAWSHGGEPGTVVLEQGTKGEWKRFDREPGASLEPKDNPYFQRIKTRSPEVIGGVCRKFLGLKPGHTYRLWARMNTFEMDEAEGNWSFSFHAVAHGKDVTLTAGQMAGAAPLPDGSAGLTAGQVGSYGPGSTTKGQFVELSTEKSDPNSQVRDITLPPGAEVITVWFRYSGPPSRGVGFDWIKLKDITTG